MSQRELRLLIVEDEVLLAEALKKSLEEHGFLPVLAHSAHAAWEALWRQPFELVVLDVSLPEGDEAGFDFARELREAGFRQPVLFLSARDALLVLSARDALLDRVRGLEHGDDYLAKPFAVAEVVARLKALDRRGEVRPKSVLWRDFELLPESRQLRCQGELVRLTAKEYEVLELFMLNPGRVFNRSEVLERVWGADYESPSNLVDVYVKNLRLKLREDVVETVRGLGYRFSG